MAYDPINLGSAPNDGTGDTLRAAGTKINAMLQELFERSNCSGSGSPEGVVTRKPGAQYVDETNGFVYYKLSGTGNTGWVALGGS